jgi:hypothetical protein
VASLLSALSCDGSAAHTLLHRMLASCDPDTGLPSIFLACQRGSACAVEQMCYAGANVQHVDVTGRNLYHYLAACIPKLHPHTVLVVAAASCGLPSHRHPGTKCIVVRAPHGNEMFIPKGACLRFRGKLKDFEVCVFSHMTAQST